MHRSSDKVKMRSLCGRLKKRKGWSPLREPAAKFGPQSLGRALRPISQRSAWQARIYQSEVPEPGRVGFLAIPLGLPVPRPQGRFQCASPGRVPSSPARVRAGFRGRHLPLPRRHPRGIPGAAPLRGAHLPRWYRPFGGRGSAGPLRFGSTMEPGLECEWPSGSSLAPGRARHGNLSAADAHCRLARTVA